MGSRDSQMKSVTSPDAAVRRQPALGHVKFVGELLQINSGFRSVPYRNTMATFVYRCPLTGLNVQGWIASDAAESSDVFEALQCLACGVRHLVNPATGKVIGGNGKDKEPKP